MKINMQSDYNNGYLEVIIGPMYSGKTSYLLNIFKQYSYCNCDVLVFNHDTDNRYDESMLSTHDKLKIPCTKTDELLKYVESEEFNKSKVILINEGQFFKDLFAFTLYAVESKSKHVYVCGLDGDFKRKKFGQINDLISYSDKVTKLTSLCYSCKNGNKAIFSHRLTNEKQQHVVGSDNYVPLCRSCYLKHNNLDLSDYILLEKN